MRIVRYDFYHMPPTYEPEPPSAGNGGGDGDGIPKLMLLGVIGAYGYGYAELVQFIGLEAVWAAMLFLPFTVALIMSPAAVVVIIEWVSGAEAGDKADSSTREKASADAASRAADEGSDDSTSNREASGIEVSIEHVDGATIATVKGRIDDDGVAKLERALKAEINKNRAVIVDVSGVTYVSSSGLRVFLLSMRSLRERGSNFALAAPGPSLRAVLDVSGFTHILPIYSGVQQAIAGIGDAKFVE